MITICKEKGYLSKIQLETVQQQCDNSSVTNLYFHPGNGRIPHKISSDFASFPADQWKNWTLIYSVIALKGILPGNYMQSW